MNGERTADDVSRRLARASGRRAVLAGLVASLAAGVAGASGGPVAERASHRDCRDRRGCGFGERCVRGRCKRRTGFAGRNQACEIDADCTQVDGPTVCVMASPCVCGDGGPKDGPAPCQP